MSRRSGEAAKAEREQFGDPGSVVNRSLPGSSLGPLHLMAYARHVMRRSGGAACAGLGASMVLVSVVFAAQSLPEGRGRTEFEAVCGRCHPVERSTMLRLNEAQWQAIVDDMIGRGAEGSSDDFSRIVTYLAEHFGPNAPGPIRKVNVNRATASELTSVLGLAKADADAIVRHREEHGAYDGWPDLEKVSGLDLKKLETVKDRIEFDVPKGSAS